MVYVFEQQQMQNNAFREKNPGKKYYIENGNERVILGVTDSERDLGVIIGKDCKNSQQAEKSINQANIALGRMRKTFQFFGAAAATAYGGLVGGGIWDDTSALSSIQIYVEGNAFTAGTALLYGVK